LVYRSPDPARVDVIPCTLTNGYSVCGQYAELLIKFNMYGACFWTGIVTRTCYPTGAGLEANMHAIQ
jgi:hypothetical protein